MSNGKHKGNAFEREICSVLSKWWTNNESDCVFWRTSSSGGRATQRAKRGEATKNHHGDITATDPIGQPLLDIITMELKCGYSIRSIADLLDVPERSAPQYEKWIAGIAHSARCAGSYSWLLIVRRNRRKTIVFTPKHLIQTLESIAVKNLRPVPHIIIEVEVDGQVQKIVGMTLAGFLDNVKPELIKLLAEKQR